MTDETLDSIAADLVAIPPRPVDPDVLAQADPDVLAAALRRAVADLPANEQRTRLAAAFSAMSPTVGDDAEPAIQGLDAELIGATHTLGMARPEDKPLVSPATAGLLALRPFTAVKAAALAGIAIIALLAGVLAGVVTDEDPVEQVAVPGAAQQPIGLLQPVGHGAAPPTDAQVAAMSLPDPAAQIEAAEAAAAADPEAFEEEGIDPADTALIPDPNFDPYVSGYVDDPGGVAGPEPGDLADPDDPDSGVTPRPTADDGDGTADGATPDEGPTDEDPTDEGTSGDGGVPEPPAGDSSDEGSDDGGVVDLCAGDTPPTGCEGVGGTVTLAIVRPFAFIEDPVTFTTWPSCAGDDVDVADDQFVIYVATNNLGTFTARYRIAGSGDPFQEVTGATDELWREAYDPETFAWTNACMVAPRPTQEATQLEVQITGIGDGDSGTATFNGVLDLAIAENGVRRDGRPDVRVDAISASEFDVYVPVGTEETSEVTLVQRDPAGEPDCEAEVVGEGERLITAREVGGITFDPDWRDEKFRITATDPGYFAICVLWTDNFTPPNELERAVITLDVPDVTSTTFLYARYDQNGCLGGGCPSVPLMTMAQVTPVGGDTCHANLYQGGYHPGSPIEMCTISGVPNRLLLTTLSGFNRSDGGIRLDGEQGRVEAAFDPTCERTTCTTWYSVPVRAPGGFFDGNGGIVGRALVGVRVDGGTAGVVVGSEGPQAIADASIDGPRLDWSSVRVRLDETDPSRSIVVEWAADRPVTMTIEAADTSSHGSCPTVTKSTTVPEVSGVARLTGLCPGELHYVGFLLTDEVGNTTLYNSLRGPRRADFDYVQRAVPIQTEPLAVVYDYELEFKEYELGSGEEITGKGIIPTWLYLELPGHTAIDYRQLYYGEPYFGLDCSNPGHFNQSGSGVRVELSGDRFRIRDTEFQFETYRSPGSWDRVCPSVNEQYNHSPTVDEFTCYFSVRNFEATYVDGSQSSKIDHLLNGGVGTWVATVDSRCRDTSRSTTLEATLTVRLRPA